MQIDFSRKHVLITGGTRGIGLAAGLAFARLGAQCTLTHRWGSADENEIRARFLSIGGPAPAIEEADVADAEDTSALMARLAARGLAVDIFISNAACAPPIASVEQYVKRDFLRGIEFTAWPLAAYPLAINKAFGRYPKYIVGITSAGTVKHVDEYDAVAVAKSALETMCRYLAHRLGPQGVRVNLVRAGYVDTDALRAVIGSTLMDRMKEFFPEYVIPAQDVAQAVVALCTGLLDGVIGHVLDVDHGTLFSDSVLLALRRMSLATQER
jgi:NAD(P)-dependent dehydrogenase (short-subunit alcohol dehydrogenase family)